MLILASVVITQNFHFKSTVYTRDHGGGYKVWVGTQLLDNILSGNRYLVSISQIFLFFEKKIGNGF